LDYYAFLLGDPNEGADDATSMEDILEQIECADRGGFVGCFVAEHHNDRHQSLTSRPGLLIAAAAARTTKLRFGTMITILGIHHPYFIAEEIATLDVLSGGRIEYGIGVGGPAWWRQVGGVHAEASARLEEGIPLLQAFLRGEQMDYEGSFWSGTSARVVPLPIQQPVPLWLSGHSDGSIRRAARFGMNFCTGFVSCDVVRERRAVYREEWEAHHAEPPGRMGHMVLAAVGESKSEIERIALPAMRTKLFEFAKATLGKSGDPTYTFDRALRERYAVETWDDLVTNGIIVYGTVAECQEQFGYIAEHAGEALLIQARFGDLDRTFSRESIGRLASEVLPSVGGQIYAQSL
jgi:alkanesulfonate monooxygenase SsuD/methylene tetrahydromethanopterin reductase-like flavin-dependent oxidoreductase (luciferase family)